MQALTDAFQLKEKGTICFVGAGGKTSLMFRTADTLSQAGYTVMTTTTTKIRYPSTQQSSCVIVSDNFEKIHKKVKKYVKQIHHITVAAAHADHSKLIGFDRKFVDLLWHARIVDWILVEGDGAREKPLKVPAQHEPVIPRCTKKVIAVIGLDSIGCPLNEKTVFRSQLFSELTGLPLNHPITEESVVSAINHKEGILRNCPTEAERYVFFNKADSKKKVESGRKCLSFLIQNNTCCIKRVLIGNAKEQPLVCCWYDMEKTDNKDSLQHEDQHV